MTDNHSHPSGPASDAWALVAAAGAGDPDAFADLYRRYRHRIAGLIQAKTGDRELAADLASETFLRAWRRIDRVTAEVADPWSWLARIAHNLVLDHYKSARVRTEQITDQPPEPSTGDRDEPDPAAWVRARAERAAVAATVARCLVGLTEGQRRAVELYDLTEPRSISAAAQAMGRHEKAVMMLRTRAVRAMRDQLTAQGLTSTAACVEAATTLTGARHRQPGISRIHPGPWPATPGQVAA